MPGADSVECFVMETPYRMGSRTPHNPPHYTDNSARRNSATGSRFRARDRFIKVIKLGYEQTPEEPSSEIGRAVASFPQT